MKRLYIGVLICLLHISNLYAREFEVTCITVENNETETTPEHRHCRSIWKLPTIEQSYDLFSISSLPYDKNIEVYFLDNLGYSIYDYHCFPTEEILDIQVPHGISKEVTKVVLKVNEKTYIGQ